MGQAKRKRELGITNYPPKRRIKVGEIQLPQGKVRIEMPAELTKQGKYDVATALAKATKALIEEADAMADDGSGL